jgi:LmbE family N-acetylglucosaminyl deacetylase
MTFTQPTASVFVPDGTPLPGALGRVTHLGVGAHPDDLEFMAFHGIIQCFHSPDQEFAGVTCTNGSGSSRAGAYKHYSDAEMVAVRREEQRQAAIVGRYAAMIQLDHPGDVAKSATDTRLRDDLTKILTHCQPRIVYTHNPADKHDAHVGVAIALIEALRALPADRRPAAVHGCEVWRNLDWLNDDEKVLHDVSGHENLAAALNGLFDSQIAGGKRYDLAVMGRRRANATFFDAHATDAATGLAFAMDLTPLVNDRSLDIIDWTLAHIKRFASDVRTRLAKRLGR